jgi:hypothetical protein
MITKSLVHNFRLVTVFVFPFVSEVLIRRRLEDPNADANDLVDKFAMQPGVAKMPVGADGPYLTSAPTLSQLCGRWLPPAGQCYGAARRTG